MFVSMQQADRVSSSDLSLLKHCKVETGHPTPQESLLDIVTPKLDAKLVARKSGLGHHQFGRSNLKLVANMYCIFKKSCERQVLTKHPPGQFHLWKLLSPERVMFRWISIDCFIQSSMDSKISLSITIKIQPSNSNPTHH